MKVVVVLDVDDSVFENRSEDTLEGYVRDELGWLHESGIVPNLIVANPTTVKAVIEAVGG
jgi:hypothetical protein